MRARWTGRDIFPLLVPALLLHLETAEIQVLTLRRATLMIGTIKGGATVKSSSQIVPSRHQREFRRQQESTSDRLKSIHKITSRVAVF